MKKRLLALLMAAVLVLGLTATAFAVGPETTAEPTASTAPTEEPEASTETTAEPEASTEPTEEPTASTEPTEEPEASTEPTEEPETSTAPTEEPEPVLPQQQGVEGPEFEGQITPSAAPSDELPQDVQDEPQPDTTADSEDELEALTGGIKVTVTSNETGRTLATIDGQPFVSGDTVEERELPDGSQGYGLKVSPEGKGIAVYTDEGDGGWLSYDPDEGLIRLSDPDGDGEVAISLVNVEHFTLKIEDDLGAALTIKEQGGAEVKSGDEVYYENASVNSVDLTATLDEGYALSAADGQDQVSYDPLTGVLTLADNGDGAVMLLAEERPMVKLVVQGAAEKATFADQTGKAVTSGDMVYLYEALYVTLESGYGILSSDDYTLRAEPDGRYSLYPYATPGSEVVVTINSYIKLHMEGDGMVAVSQDAVFSDSPIGEGGSLLTGEEYLVTVKNGYAAEATGGKLSLSTVFENGFCLDGESGQVVRVYDLVPDGSGQVTVKAVASKEKAPDPIQIKFVDKDGVITGGYKYAWPGDGIVYFVKEGYSLSVKGGTAEFSYSEGGTSSYIVDIDEDATAVTITSVKLSGGATLKVSGSKSALLSSRDGVTYPVDGDKLANGYGFVLVKSGYAITGAEGGSVGYYNSVWDWTKPGESEIYALYYVEARSDTVTITVKKAAPNRWVKVNLVNYFDEEVTLYAQDDSAVQWVQIIPAGSTYVFVGLGSVNNGDASQFTLAVQGGSLIEEQPYGDASSGCSYTIDPGDSSEITVTVVKKNFQPDLEVLVPDKPAAGVPGVPDKAAAEKRLMDEASAMVDAIMQGEKPAGVSKTDAAAIGEAAADGKTITTQLVTTAVAAPADAAVLQTAAGEDAILQYIDVQIVVLADGQTIGHITQTKKAVELAVALSDEELEQGMIFYVIRSHNGKTSVLSATLSGNILCFATNKFSTFAVTATNDIAYADVSPIDDQTYTGSAIRPAVEVTVNGNKTLKEGMDYTLSYEDNVNTGTATVIITGIGDYSGTKEATFQIVAPPAGGRPGAAPPTGDETPLALYAALLALCAGGLALTVSRKKRADR